MVHFWRAVFLDRGLISPIFPGEIKGRFPGQGWFWRMCPRSGGTLRGNIRTYLHCGFSFRGNIRMYPCSGFRSGGTSAKTTLLETTLLGSSAIFLGDHPQNCGGGGEKLGHPKTSSNIMSMCIRLLSSPAPLSIIIQECSMQLAEEVSKGVLCLCHLPLAEAILLGASLTNSAATPENDKIRTNWCMVRPGRSWAQVLPSSFHDFPKFQ